jgi:hypothetical protein
MKHRAAGWYRDPYQVHEDRYFSDGSPTKLVRDDGRESYDDPPDLPCDEHDLVPVPEQDDAEGGSDLRRADEAEAGDEPPYDAETAKQLAFDVFDTGGYWLPPRRHRPS